MLTCVSFRYNRSVVTFPLINDKCVNYWDHPHRPAVCNGESCPKWDTDEGNREANVAGEASDVAVLQTASQQLESGDEVQQVWL